MENNQRIKLFVDAHCFDKEHQGTRSFIKGLYLELNKVSQGIDFIFGAKDIANLKTEFKDISNCTFIQYKFSGSLSRLLFEVPFIIYKHKVDIAHFQYISPFIKNCKHVLTTHDVLFNDFKSEFSTWYRLSRNFLFKYSIRRADLKTTVSEYSKKSIHQHYNIDLDHIHVISNSIGFEYHAPYDKEVSKKQIWKKFGIGPYILSVSRFEPRKNQATLLRAYIDLKLHLKGHYLVLLGHESIKTPAFNVLLKSLSKEVQKYIFINTNVGHEDLFHFYRGANVFVYLSKAEGFGLPPIEAGALRIPVICSNTTAMSDFSFFGEYHLDPANYSLICEKLQKLVDSAPDDGCLQDISNKISEYYEPGLAAKKFSELLGSCVHRELSVKYANGIV